MAVPEALDTEEHRRRRAEMVERQLRARGIHDERVLAAMAELPRHLFVPPAQRDMAYEDRAMPIGEGQTISQPYMVALMLQALKTTPETLALEVGAGSGYQAALLGMLCRKVYAVEIVDALAERARNAIELAGIDNVEIVTGDGSLGLPEHAPYDAIIVAAGAPELPRPLLEQLADGGRLVAPVGGSFSQQLIICERRGEEISREHGIACVFVPLRGEHGWHNE
ncbi:MAG: protein-L-isoaspartate(D-aspartate) O-methyltransferase [Armatimonadetes bacterium]|nr:protein-L-isoaspartate(D-aspartate) O-methyltransferase [Armatimonadota bacterium]